jgi:hypothetical protein
MTYQVTYEYMQWQTRGFHYMTYMAMTYLWHIQWHTQWHTVTYNDKLEVFIKLHGHDIPMTYPMTYPKNIRVHAMTNSRFSLNYMAMTYLWHTYDISNDILNDIRLHTMTNSRFLLNDMAMTYLWHIQWHTQWHTSTYNDKREVFIKLHGNDIPMTYPMTCQWHTQWHTSTYNDKLEVFIKLHGNDIPNNIPNDIRLHAMTNSRFSLNDMAMTYLWHIQWHTQWHTSTYNDQREVFIKLHGNDTPNDMPNDIPNDIRVHTMTKSRFSLNYMAMTYLWHTQWHAKEYIQWQTRGFH